MERPGQLAMDTGVKMQLWSGDPDVCLEADHTLVKGKEGVFPENKKNAKPGRERCVGFSQPSCSHESA